MSRRTTGFGHLFKWSGSWHTRLSLAVHGKRVQKSVKLCAVDEQHPTKESVIDLAREALKREQVKAEARTLGHPYNCPTCGRLVHTRREKQPITNAVATPQNGEFVPWRNSYSI